jgi:hypothetical protein
MTHAKTTPSNSHITLMQRPFGAPRFHFDENAGGGDAAAVAAAAAAAAAATPWHNGIDAEFIGHAQNKGWKLDDPKEAFIAATKQARELERHFGVPADRLVKLPGPDAKPEDIRAYHERIGAPKEAKDYDLSPIKDQAIADSLRASLHNSGVTKDAAAAVAKSVATALESQLSQQSTENATKVQEAKDRLKVSWGQNFEYNKLKAADGARRLGMSPETVAAMEGMIGYDGIMETLRKIGAGTSEDTFVDRGLGTNGQVTTREGAVARKAELMADKAWGERYLKGGVAEVREMTGLNMMIAGSGT